MSETEVSPAIVEQKKKGRAGGIVLAVVIFAAILAGLLFWFNKKQNVPITAYAPVGTNLIVFINSQKITENKVWLAAKEQFKDEYAELKKDAEKEGIILDEILKSQLVLFADLRDLNNGSGAAVVKFNDKVAEKYFNLFAEKRNKEKCSSITVEGKPGLLGKEKDGSGAYLVVVSDTMLQGRGARNLTGEPSLLKETGCPIAKEIDTDALLSIAFDFKSVNVSNDVAEALSLKEYNAEELVNGLLYISFNIRENGNNIESRLIFTYENKDQAGKSGETVKALVVLGKKAVAAAAKKQSKKEDDQLKKTLENITVEVKNNDVILSGSEDMDNIIAQIKSGSECLKNSHKGKTKTTKTEPADDGTVQK